ncbi:28S ribosomal protein S6, mitochondrial [Cymbomonas tetramitiformis]|uniref:28S ribosomal protein S6, mitochondrial n=1 Tax=Cymbomonas tetramitiformis TaxID=36881 RepID=A0AAE0BZ14_9CHLO|nr:28S ribosomal protein S6, mitochondrial [Cymbomonas tetramitiformis]|eukprot:gene9456-11200_t
MPLYELMYMVKPAVKLPQLFEFARQAGKEVISKGGVITKITSYGRPALAYPIKKPGARYEEAHIMQMNFMLNSKELKEIRHTLSTDERILRWMILKHSKFPSQVTFHRYLKKLDHDAFLTDETVQELEKVVGPFEEVDK